MIKRLAIFILSCAFLCITVFANGFYATVTPSDDFFEFDSEPQKVCDILGMPESDIKEYCHRNSVQYFATDSTGDRQIKIIVNSSDFSKSVISLSNLEDADIKSIMTNIIGSSATGEIINRSGQKFVKSTDTLDDNGGKYVLTKYFTVADSMCYTLSFTTAEGKDTKYTEETFDSYYSGSFADTDGKKYFSVAIPIAIIVFSAICAVIVFTIVKDVKADKKN